MLQFEEAVQTVGKEGTPHVLCAYLYELAGVFSSFYEHCPILNAEDENVKLSRLKLASLTEGNLKQGLGYWVLRQSKNVKSAVNFDPHFFFISTKMSIAASPPHSFWELGVTLGL